MLFVWSAKRAELIAEENKHAALRFAAFEVELVPKVALGLPG